MNLGVLRLAELLRRPGMVPHGRFAGAGVNLEMPHFGTRSVYKLRKECYRGEGG